MKKIILLFFMLLWGSLAHADSNVDNLTSKSTPASADETYIVDIAGGTVDKKTTISGIFASANITANNSNVGIGTINPQSILAVGGGVSIGTDYATQGSPTNGLITEGNVAIGTKTPGGYLTVGSTGGFTVSSNGSIVANSLQTSTLSSAAFSNVNIAPGSNFTVTENSVVPFTIASGLNNVANTMYLTSGNVGIGSTAPGQALDVQGTVRATGFSGPGTGFTGIMLASGATTGATSQTQLFTNNVGINTAVAGQNLVVGGNIVAGGSFTTGGGSATVSGNGSNVGIGSTAAGQALDVNGTVRASYFLGNGSLLSGINASGGGWTTSGNNVYETSSGNVGIGTGIVTNGALLIMNGNVGIGTWIPVYQLDVTGTARITGGITTTTTNPTTFGSNVGIGTFTTNQFTVNGGVSIDTANGQYVQTVAPTGGLIMSGNLGVASYNPGQILDIGGTARITAITGQFIGPGIVLSVKGTLPPFQGAYSAAVAATNFLLMDVQGTLTQPFTVNSNGNVGIGSSVPGVAFDVQGTVRFNLDKSLTGVRYLCIGTAGQVESQPTACVGT